ncbi:MAG: 4Fe-4S binding protein [Alphaproteobacteria bacterium]|nr:4Fe-4S binding protein [Alphaproteobacteria bacterium]
MSKKLVLCDCLGTQSLDPEAIGAASGLACSKLYTGLCTSQIADAAEAIKDGDAIIACQQERQRFEELADELGVDAPGFVDLRDRAGWSDHGADAAPKMAALAAEALIVAPAPKTMDVASEGVCLVVGGGEVAVEAARALSDHLSVTLLLSGDADVLPLSRDFEVVRGTLAQAKGALGNFSVRIDGFQEMEPGGRGAFTFTPARDGAQSGCDIIVDLSGETALFPAHEKREGYLRADPKSPTAVAAVVLEASHMVGTFEQPLYVRLEESLCAHSRAEQPACSRCLNLCPTGAITPNGETVAVDPLICAGCGACSAVCPTGAISYDAPPVATVFRRIDTLAGTYRKAGGGTPRLLVTDGDHGLEMISLAARFGRGLPADVIPMAVDALNGFGHAEMLAALGAGFGAVDVLLSPKTERDPLEAQLILAEAIAGEGKLRLLDLADPDALSDALFGVEVAAVTHDPILPIGTRRQVTRVAAKALMPDAEMVALPAGAPYGAVQVDSDACTLCLSCASLCPTGALGDNPDLPQLRFQEDACVQCGLCSNLCPEKAITLEPRLNLTDAAYTQQVVNEEEPFACIECGALFGVKSTVDKIMEKLAGKHSMFQNPQAARMIQMCDDCRVNAQYHMENNPFAGGERPRPRTTDDYFSKRRDH